MADYDPGNIFARILRGELPAYQVCEDDATLVFMDIMPRGEGHCLVLPKAAARNLLDIEPESLAATLRMVQRVARASMVAFAADGVTIQQFNEAAGGQVVFHLHVHVIPRFAGTPLRPHTGAMEDGEVLERNAAKLRGAIQSV